MVAVISVSCLTMIIGIQHEKGYCIPIQGYLEHKGTRSCGKAFDLQLLIESIICGVPGRLRDDAPLRPGLALPDGMLPEGAEGPRGGPVDVEEGQLPRQRRDGEPVLGDEEGDVLRTRKGIPQLRGIPGQA
jgi:hypothetical protein